MTPAAGDLRSFVAGPGAAAGGPCAAPGGTWRPPWRRRGRGGALAAQSGKRLTGIHPIALGRENLADPVAAIQKHDRLVAGHKIAGDVKLGRKPRLPGPNYLHLDICGRLILLSRFLSRARALLRRNIWNG